MIRENLYSLVRIFVSGIACCVGYRGEMMRIVQYRIDKDEKKRRKKRRTLGNWITLSLYYDVVPLIFFIFYYILCIFFAVIMVMSIIAAFRYDPERTKEIIENYQLYLVEYFGTPLLIYLIIFVFPLGPGPPRWM